MVNMSFEDKVWYQKLSFKNILAVAPLLPFTALFGAITSVRRKCYNNGFFKKTKLLYSTALYNNLINFLSVDNKIFNRLNIFYNFSQM